MPAEIIGELIVKPILELVVQLIGYFTSRLLCPVITFGHISVAPTEKGVKVKPRWHGINRASNGKIVLHEEMGAFLGIIFWLVIILACILYSKTQP